MKKTSVAKTKKPLPKKFRHDSTRGWFAYELYNQMVKDESIWVLTGDLGYKMLDFIKKDFPERFLNVGSAELAMIDIAVGLALKGKKPFVYSITTFLLRRPFEALFLYLHHEGIPVRLIGAGRDHDYALYGMSHWSNDDKDIMNVLKNIHALWPTEKQEIPKLVKQMVTESEPWYINLSR